MSVGVISVFENFSQLQNWAAKSSSAMTDRRREHNGGYACAVLGVQAKVTSQAKCLAKFIHFPHISNSMNRQRPVYQTWCRLLEFALQNIC